ncbi:hypothetical protein EYF80_008466 [Liparis tanakae]|uniref:Uncharacterized protein n=1 Tax=Liparis tanakae TaxID=230148 RepID=A0A4Z2ITU8_9TELE|nr:hypothetical protein EYF80_008466 [Liparis tanakae]
MNQDRNQARQFPFKVLLAGHLHGFWRYMQALNLRKAKEQKEQNQRIVFAKPQGSSSLLDSEYAILPVELVDQHVILLLHGVEQIPDACFHTGLHPCAQCVAGHPGSPPRDHHESICAEVDRAEDGSLLGGLGAVH